MVELKSVAPTPRRELKAVFDEASRQWVVTPRYTGKTYSGSRQWNHEAMQAIKMAELMRQVGQRTETSDK